MADSLRVCVSESKMADSLRVWVRERDVRESEREGEPCLRSRGLGSAAIGEGRDYRCLASGGVIENRYTRQLHG